MQKNQVERDVTGKQIVDICSIEYFTAIKRNKLLIHKSAWINLKSIVLSHRSLIWKNKYYMVLFLCKILYGGIYIFSNIMPNFTAGSPGQCQI
jgi:hypothetical protein